MDSSENPTLQGKRVVITRAARQGVSLFEKLSALGASPIAFPLVSFATPEDFAPLDAALDQFESFDWVIFTSENAVYAVEKRASVRGNIRRADGRRARAAAVGPTTAEAARRAGFFVDYEAQTHSGAALANELGERLRNQTVLLPRSDRANPDLPAILRSFGAKVTEVVAYRTVTPENRDQKKVAQITNGEVDAILFFSPTAVAHFVEVIGAQAFSELQNHVAITAVGPVTANALAQCGVARVVLSSDTTIDAVIAALQNHFAATTPLAAGANQQ